MHAVNQTLATITLQNYFRMFEKLAGMTGTAMTEASEFSRIYDLDVVQIPTNRPNQRNDINDQIYLDEKSKLDAIVEEIRAECSDGRPVLLGTTSIAKSESISDALKEADIEHNVLNAKQHEREAEIITQAGRKGAVTVATNMAGRGTDIVLGGKAEALWEKRCQDQGLEPDSAGAKTLLEELEEQCKAEHEEVLDLGGNYLGSAGAARIATACSALPRLRQLRLSEIGAHTRSNHCNSSCLRHSIRSRSVTNQSYHISTLCPRSSAPFYIVSYYIKLVTTSWTYSTMHCYLRAWLK